jgi:hypothetical protein
LKITNEPEKTEKEEVQDLQGMVYTIQLSSETMHEDELHTGSWAPRARTPAEAGFTPAEGKAEDPPELDR